MNEVSTDFPASHNRKSPWCLAPGARSTEALETLPEAELLRHGYGQGAPPFVKFLLEGAVVPIAKGSGSEPWKFRDVDPRILVVARETQRILEKLRLMPRRLTRSA